jgi:hypothetical protein
MKYMILMGDGGGAWEKLSAAEQAQVIERHGAFRRALEAEGKYVGEHRLAGPETARTVKLDARGQVYVTDGPFTESKEVVGGLYIIEAETIDEAVEWTRRCRFIPGSSEVRPLFDG